LFFLSPWQILWGQRSSGECMHACAETGRTMRFDERSRTPVRLRGGPPEVLDLK
jgi:hypothetical protein